MREREIVSEREREREKEREKGGGKKETERKGRRESFCEREFL